MFKQTKRYSNLHFIKVLPVRPIFTKSQAKASFVEAFINERNLAVIHSIHQQGSFISNVSMFFWSHFFKTCVLAYHNEIVRVFHDALVQFSIGTLWGRLKDDMPPWWWLCNCPMRKLLNSWISGKNAGR